MSIERELLKRAYQYRGSDMPLVLEAAIEAELAKPEPEPVAWMVKFKDAGIVLLQQRNDRPDFEDGNWVDHEYIPLYASPTARKSLSNSEILRLARDNYPSCNQMILKFARAIEKSHGIDDLNS